MPIVETLVQALQAGLAFLLIITVLVYVHELGHYWAAKACGMHVDAFAVMMGGVRKTELRDRLKKPLVSAWALWGTGIAAAVLAFAGAMAEVQALFIAGMVFLTFVGPVWVISRLCALYHVPLSQGIGYLVKSWAAVALILFIGTRFQNLDAGYGLGMTLAGSVVAVLLTYYLPVLRKAEDAPQGHGQLEIEGEEVPVRFRPVWSKTNKEGTEFSLLLLPLGGFAAIKGMHPKADGSEVRIEKGFYSKPAWQRFIVLGAGPAFSIILGILLLIPVFRFQGLMEPVPVVGAVLDDSAASKAGLKEDDRITAINGQPVVKWMDLVKNVRFAYDTTDNGGIVPHTLAVAYERDGKEFTAELIPTVSDEPETVLDDEGMPTAEKKRHALIGISPQTEYFPMSWSGAVNRSLEEPGNTVKQFALMLTSYEVAKQSVGGPGQTFQAAGMAVREGIWVVLLMAGSLSIVLGVLNLMPFPPLDGGQMVIALVEMLRGNRRLSPNLQGTLHTIGFFIVAVIMIAPFIIDAGRRAESNQAAAESQKEKPATSGETAPAGSAP